MANQGSGARAELLWRPVVALAGLSSAIAAAAIIAAVLPATDGAWAAMRGSLIAATSLLTLVGVATGARRLLAAAGVSANDPFVSASAPPGVQAAYDRIRRSRSTALAAGLLAGLFLAGLGGGMDARAPGWGWGDDRAEVRLASDGTRLVDGDGGDGARNDASVAGARRDAGEGAQASDGQDSTVAGDSSGTTPGGGGGDGTTTTTKPKGGSGTTTTTKPKGGVDCPALDEFPGNVDALLAGLGVSRDAITRSVCDQIEDLLDDPTLDLDDLIDELTDLLDNLPVPVTTTITVPKVTTTTITVPKVTTTTVTVPQVTTTTITVPKVTTTTITVPITLPKLPGL